MDSQYLFDEETINAQNMGNYENINNNNNYMQQQQQQQQHQRRQTGNQEIKQTRSRNTDDEAPEYDRQYSRLSRIEDFKEDSELVEKPAVVAIGDSQITIIDTAARNVHGLLCFFLFCCFVFRACVIIVFFCLYLYLCMCVFSAV